MTDVRLEDEPWELSEDEVISLDKSFVWHPFTPVEEWTSPGFRPLVLVSGEGATLRDINGRDYIDGNASIWTNVHGHCHPRIDAALRKQLERVAHTSFLGFTHPNAAVLARELVGRAPGPLKRVFYSDNGSTANEAALRMAMQYRAMRGESERRPLVAAFDLAYHGDTYGVASLGGIELFSGGVPRTGIPVRRFSSIDQLRTLDRKESEAINAVMIEPLVQGPAGMRLWPSGMLGELRAWCDEFGVLLILDEVMTGFGRTGTMFACEREGVCPDILNLAKGITGGYLPLAASLVTEGVYEAFRGGPERTFYYGHSYTANPLGCAAALASLAVFDEERVIDSLAEKIEALRRALAAAEGLEAVAETRQAGLAAAVELRGTTASTRDLAARHCLGAAVCVAAREHGLLTRPIGNAVIFLPPLCISGEMIERSIQAIEGGLADLH